MSQSRLLETGSNCAVDITVESHQERDLPQNKPKAVDLCVGWSVMALATITWISLFFFALYVMAWYLSSFPHNTERWDPYNYKEPAAKAGIAIHFFGGVVLMALGSIQLVKPLRRKWPVFHRWTGRVYIAASLLASSGGLTIIMVRGTGGGPVQSIAFGLGGALTLVSAI